MPADPALLVRMYCTAHGLYLRTGRPLLTLPQCRQSAVACRTVAGSTVTTVGMLVDVDRDVDLCALALLQQCKQQGSAGHRRRATRLYESSAVEYLYACTAVVDIRRMTVTATNYYYSYYYTMYILYSTAECTYRSYE